MALIFNNVLNAYTRVVKDEPVYLAKLVKVFPSVALNVHFMHITEVKN